MDIFPILGGHVGNKSCGFLLSVTALKFPKSHNFPCGETVTRRLLDFYVQ